MIAKQVQVAECAHAFQHLLDVEYQLLVGKKGKTQELHISFAPSDFPHLAGLHKLTDVSDLRRNRNTALGWLLTGKLTDSDLYKSVFFEDIQPRLVVLRQLETILDSNDTIFHFLANACKGSRIQADWLLQSPIEDQLSYIFLRQREESVPEQLFCCSMFLKAEKDFSASQPRFTLLRKEKSHKKTGAVDILYDRAKDNPKSHSHSRVQTD